VDLNQLVISAVQKARFRTRFTAINKQVLDGQKAQQKLEVKQAVDAINSHFQDPANKDSSWFVVKLPNPASAKAVSESINHVKSKLQNKNVYVMAVDSEHTRVAHGCHMSKVSYSMQTETIIFDRTLN
jgi:alanyl-tRNA synthetase